MKRFWIFVSLIVVLTLAACGTAPAASDTKVATRQLNASGQGKVYLVPDLAYVTIGVHTEAATVAEALKNNNTQAQAIQKALTGLGVDVKDIQTSAFNVYPQTQQPNPKTGTGGDTVTVYVVENTVSVTVRSLSNLGSLLDQVVGAGANSINGIQFDVQDKEKALSQARKAAIDQAKAQAQEIAQASGVTLGTIQSINVTTGGTTNPVYYAKGGFQAADSSVPVSSGQLLITADASLAYEIK
jgi:uncharacterized protein